MFPVIIHCLGQCAAKGIFKDCFRVSQKARHGIIITLLVSGWIGSGYRSPSFNALEGYVGDQTYAGRIGLAGSFHQDCQTVTTESTHFITVVAWF